MDCAYTPGGDRSVTRPIAMTDPEGIDPVDGLLIMVKTDATAEALEVATPMTDSETIVASFHNGFTAHEMIPDQLESRTFVSGTTRHGTRVAGPGEIYHDSTGETVVGGDSDAAERVAELLTTAGFETKATTDIRPYRWSKQFVSIGVKPTAALTGHRNGNLVEFDAATTVLEGLVKEADRVCEAHGIDAITSDPVAMVKTFCRKNTDHVSSALEDVRNHWKMEREYIDGEIVRYGEQANIPAPYNRLVTNLITAMEHRYQSQSSRSNG